MTYNDYELDPAVGHTDELEIAMNGHSDRHPTLEMITAKLHAMIIGRAAGDLLEHPEAIPELAAVWVAPSWSWRFARIKVGRKDRAPDGSRYRLPVRMMWEPGPVSIISPGRRRRHYFTVDGLGHVESGSLLVGTCEGVAREPVLDAAGVPVSAEEMLRGHSEVLSELARLVRAGEAARWEALLWLEPYVEQALSTAHTSVSIELAEALGERKVLLDETKQASIANQMLFGDEEHVGKVSQMLERCLAPETFRRVDPVKYIKEALRRDANASVRNAIGDPPPGARVRRVARELATTDIDLIVEECRRRWPYDRLGPDRVRAALSVAPDAMASWWGLSHELDDS